MARQLTTEEALGRIRAIRNDAGQPDAARELASFFRHKSNHAVAAAANAATALELGSLTPELIAAFTDVLPKAPQRDQGCKALIAIAEALVTFGEHAAEVYLPGIRYVQMEGSYGPPIDTAAPLRGLCARGLVRMRHPDALFRIVDLLADSRVPARVGAAAALGDANSETAELLLRLKVMGGDESDVIAECFRSLLAISAGRSLEFVGRYLSSGKGEEVENAALALGEARLAGALPLLKGAWSANRQAAVRRTLLFSIAMLRNEDGFVYLLERLRQDPEAGAQIALEALMMNRPSGELEGSIREIVERRNLPGLVRAFRKNG